MDISDKDKAKILALLVPVIDKKVNENTLNETRVHDLLHTRGIIEKADRIMMVKAYAAHIGADPRRNHIHQTICSSKGNWKRFKKWVDDLLDYVKPSKQNKNERN